MSARVYQFPTIPRIREQVREVMAQDSAWENYQKARKDFAEQQETNRKTAALLEWYGRKDPKDNGPEAA